MEEKIEAFKGFGPDWSCRGFRYEIGGTYRLEGKAPARCTDRGFHACGMPLDVWSYYGPATSRFAVVEASGQIDRAPEQDSKIASAEITVKAEIALPDFIKRAVDWVLARAKGNTATGDRGHAAATGDGGHAAATGHRGHAAATGRHAIAAALGVGGTAKAGPDGWIVLAAWVPDREGGYAPRHVRAAKVGGPEGVEAGVAYRLDEAGEFVRAEEA